MYHPLQIIKQLPTSINERLSENSTNEEILNKSKADYEKAIKDSGFQSTQLEYKRTAKKQTKMEAELLHGSTHYSTKMSQ